MQSNIHTFIMPEVEQVFPYVREKLVIDFINGLNSANELNAIRKQNSGLFERFKNGLSGADRMRQNHINDHILSGLEACRALVIELSSDIERNATALTKIRQHVQQTQQNITIIADEISNFRAEFDAFARQTDSALHEVRDYLNDVRQEQRAEQQLSRLMDKWEAGKYDNLAPISRCYAVLDALYWCAFGERVRMDKGASDFMDALQNKLIIQLKKDMNVSSLKDVPRNEWVAVPDSIYKNDLLEALQYQGDWCLQAPQTFATTFTATQHPLLGDEHPTVKEVRFPNMIDSQRVAERMTKDVFDWERVA